VERVYILPGQLAISEALASNMIHREEKSVAIIHRTFLGCPVVVPKCLLVKVPEQVEWFDIDIRALQSALEQAPEVFESVRVNLSVNVPLGVVDHVVAVVANQSVIRWQLIAEQCRVSSYVIADFLLDERLATICQNLSANFAATLQNSKYNRFIVRATLYDFSPVDIAVHVPSLTTDESFINFHLCSTTAKFDQRIGLHCEPDAMHHKPRGLLSDSESAVDFVGTDSVLAVRNHPNGNHPLVHANGGILEDGSDLDRELFLAALAEPKPSRGNEGMFLGVASRTRNGALRPAKRDGIVKRPLWVRKVHDCLLQRFRKFQVWGHGLLPFYA
jgi:hypothetical protein